MALAAALGFGVFFLFLAKASEHHHALARHIFVLRLTTVPLVLLALLLLRQPLRIPPRKLSLVVIVGVLDSGANTLYALATDHRPAQPGQRAQLALSADDRPPGSGAPFASTFPAIRRSGSSRRSPESRLISAG